MTDTAGTPRRQRTVCLRCGDAIWRDDGPWHSYRAGPRCPPGGRPHQSRDDTEPEGPPP